VRVPVVATAVVMTGCAQSPGLQLEVAAQDASIKTIELIVGAHCDNCPSMMAAPNVALRETSIFSSPHPDAWFADFDGSFAGFFLDVDGGDDQRIPVLGIVGYDGAKQAVAYTKMQDVLVPANGELYTRVTLKPIDPIDNTTPTTDAERVVVWRHPEQREPSCMMIEHWSSGVVTTGAIVPPTDPDCDHVLVSECSPYIPNAIDVGSSFSSANCMLVVPTPAAPVCMMGGPVCTDGEPQTSLSCGRIDEDYCVPTTLCDCAPREFGCLFGKLATGTNDGTVTTLRCTVPVDQAGKLCAGLTTAALDGSALLSSGTQCKSIRFLDAFLAAAQSLSDTTEFDATVTLKLSNFTQPCRADMLWEGAVLSPTTMHTTVNMVSFEIDTGRNIAIPLRVSTVANCNEQFACNLVMTTNDSVSLCGRPML
jgi:hypothetical protein